MQSKNKETIIDLASGKTATLRNLRAVSFWNFIRYAALFVLFAVLAIMGARRDARLPQAT